jgi:hypothetical protein
VLTGVADGRITESGTYRALAAQEDSRFRALMAAQLTAATGESLHGPGHKRTTAKAVVPEPEEGQELKVEVEAEVPARSS